MTDKWREIAFERFEENRWLRIELDKTRAKGQTWVFFAALLTGAGLACLIIDRL